jgi:RNA polymerase sigma-70 factor (ECF subfamily)
MMYLASALKSRVPTTSAPIPQRAAAEVYAPTPLSDEELVSRAQLGERNAFDSLVRKYRHRLVKICRRYIRNEDDAEDAVQMILLRAYRGLKYFRGDATFYSWLHRIAINTAVTVLALRKRDRTLFSARACNDDVPETIADAKCLETPEGIALANEIGEVVIRAIGSLCEENRTAITLHELEGMSYAEVANAMSCPLGTVRSRVSRARDAIDAQLRQVYEQGLGRSQVKSRPHLQSPAIWTGRLNARRAGDNPPPDPRMAVRQRLSPWHAQCIAIDMNRSIGIKLR